MTVDGAGQRGKWRGRVVSVGCVSAITPTARASARWKARLFRSEAHCEKCARLGIEVNSMMISGVPTLRLRDSTVS